MLAAEMTAALVPGIRAPASMASAVKCVAGVRALSTGLIDSDGLLPLISPMPRATAKAYPDVT